MIRSPLRATSTLLLLLALALPVGAGDEESGLAGASADVPAGPLAGTGALPTEVDLGYYFAPFAGAPDHDPALPTPSSELGFEVGQWHVRPSQVVEYLEELAASSRRVRLEEIGRTHEAKPQVVATISSEENLARLDEILAAHRRLSEPPFAEGGPDLSEMPAVVYLGYSIHGNEPSGTNASLLVAYHLAASRSGEVASLLDRLVILLDPSLNPDGLGRFAHWANMFRGSNPVADPNHREHVEAWPGGRTNHYWFDLNRDWLLLVHPESRNRVRFFQRWRPNVLADFHEMGSGATYFFQPGVPSRQNPLTPERNVELTREFARYHAEALDEVGSLYYTQETFDDFYFGKGSTYPDIQGTVGILFEQASARGHVQETEAAGGGLLTFPFAIRNQLLTSMSTLRAAAAEREELLAFQRRFFAEALAEAEEAPVAAYVVGDRHDPARVAELARVLLGHGIEVYRLAEELDPERTGVEAGEGRSFEPSSSIAVPVEQRQARLLEALFEQRVEFEDTTFYDVSAWTLPLAFGLPWAEIGRGSWSRELLGARLAPDTVGELLAGRVDPADDPVAWAFEWTGYYAPRALGRLLAADIQVRAATRPFTATTSDGSTLELRRGTVVIPAGLQPERAGEIRTLLGTAAREDGIVVHALGSGLTPAGIDLGSPSLRPVERPRPMVLIGDGVSSYDAGQVWHLLDHRFGLEVSLVDRSQLPGLDLDRYTHLILVDGAWTDLPEPVVEEIGRWVQAGGAVVGLKGGASWAGDVLLGLGSGEEGERMEIEVSSGGEQDEPEDHRPYASFRDDVAVPLIAGTIFEARLDLTHPLAYGYTRELLSVFRDWTGTVAPTENRYDTPVRYTEEPLLAGYVSPTNLERLAGRPAVVATRDGRGVVIRMADDPSFRGIWYGTSRLLLNALFYGPLIEATELPDGVVPQ